MYWPDTNTGVDIEPARKPVASLVRQYFTEGGAGQAPTVPGGDWFNQLTNELINLIAAAGISPSKSDDDQLLYAVQALSKATNAREALRRTYAELGLDVVAGSFELGGVVSTQDELMVFESDGHAYSWDGAFPPGGKVVPPDSTPSSSGGVGPGAWLDQAEKNLSFPGGAGRIGTAQGISLQQYIDYQSFTTVASMVADSTLVIGARVRWAGYYNIFDGGGNTGVVVASGTAVADGGSFFDLANGLQVKADMGDGIYVDRWGPVNPNAEVAFEKAIAYASANPSFGPFGSVLYLGNAGYYEVSIPVFFPALPWAGIDMDMRRSTVKKVTNTPASGKPGRLARGGTVTDDMNVDAVFIYDHPDNQYYVRGGIRGDGYIWNIYGNGIWAPRCYLMNFDEVTIDAPSGDYGWNTRDTFMCKFHSIQSIGSKRPIKWSDDGSGAATGTTCHFSRVWALSAKELGWDIYGLQYSSYDCIAADNITTPGAIGAYRFQNCSGHISGLGAENTNTSETIRFIGGQMTLAAITTFAVTASNNWMRATDGARITYSGARSDNVSGTLTNGAISAETGSVIIYDGTGPANGTRKK
ncbi:hypothetical protein, partial [Aeromonas simiae]|uniref:tail fiber/spike domain-containing protein n=1 Tax=Aeromonas simiae TaxID=218936 RepID=UPI0026F5323D|nr:hypothetical protein [Aeromonas simiae]